MYVQYRSVGVSRILAVLKAKNCLSVFLVVDKNQGYKKVSKHLTKMVKGYNITSGRDEREDI